ncbi:MAG: 30S ribosome-binding factor RbfA [candidate division Zixibacteria bacterium]|nr:30S ribosome-binding factor RbfA [candidate division Zixibacteria bacterium]
MRQFKRSQRLGEQILRDISSLLEIELSEVAPGMVTFTQVRLSDDLRYAKVYYSYLGSDEGREWIVGYFEREKGRIRSQIGRKLRIRHIPEFTFTFDPSVEHGMRIEQLLDGLKREDNQD